MTGLPVPTLSLEAAPAENHEKQSRSRLDKLNAPAGKLLKQFSISSQR